MRIWRVALIGLAFGFGVATSAANETNSAKAPANMDERSLFYLPDHADFRSQWIEKKPGETNWPFKASAGCLTCAWLMGAPAVYFVPDTPEYRDDAAVDFPVLIISVDPFEILLSNAGQSDQFVPIATIEEKIKRLAPFVAMGHALCNQPRGDQIGPAEL